MKAKRQQQRAFVCAKAKRQQQQQQEVGQALSQGMMLLAFVSPLSIPKKSLSLHLNQLIHMMQYQNISEFP